MSLRSKLATASGLNLLDYAIRFGAVFVVSPLLIRHLGKDAYGFWVVIVSVVGYLDLLDLGVGQTALRYLSRHSTERDRIRDLLGHFRRFYRRVGFVALLVSVAGGLAVPWLVDDPQVAEKARLIFWIVAIPQSLAFFVRINRIILQSRLLYHRTILAGLIRTLVNTAGILICLPAFPEVVTLALWWSASLAIEQIFLFLFSADSRATSAAALPLPREERREIRHFAGKVVGWSMASFLRERVDTQILAGFVSTTAVTHYAVGSRFIQMFTDIINSVFGGHFLAGFSQLISRDGRDAAADRLLAALRISAALSLAGGTTVFLLAPPFIDRWLGPGFEDSHLLIRLLAIPTTLILMQYPLGPFLGSQNRHGAMAVISLAGGLLNLVASLILVRSMGFPGVLVATAAELSLTALVLWPVIARAKGGIPIRAYLGTLVAPAVRLSPAIAGSAALVSFLNPRNYFHLGGTFFLIASLFTVVGWFLLLRPAERAYLRSALLARLRPGKH